MVKIEATISRFEFTTILKSIMKLNLLILVFLMSRTHSSNIDKVRYFASGLQVGEQSIKSGIFYSKFNC